MSNTMDVDDQVGLNPTIDFIAGFIAGVAGVLVGHPFDTVKIRFQTPALAGKYHSSFHAIATIIREEQIIGLYKGVLSRLTSLAVLNGVTFALYRFFVKLQLDSRDAIPTLGQVCIAGILTGIVCCFINAPTELIKIRHQDQLVLTSTRKIAMSIYEESGICGLYRGITATMLRDVGYGPYFLAYEGTCRYLSSYNGLQNLIWVIPLLAGAVAAIGKLMTAVPMLVTLQDVLKVGWVSTFPFDVVKTRMQGTDQSYTLLDIPQTEVLHSTPRQPLLSYSRVPSSNPTTTVPDTIPINPYVTVASTISYLYRTEGAGVFFSGLVPTLLCVTPTTMVTFATFELTVLVLS
ncbi:carnitine/acyl carnitine carrier [Amanita muscaria]